MTNHPRQLTPKKARKYEDILRLAKTCADSKFSWLHLRHDGRISIVNQRSGEAPTGQVSLTRREFEQFQDFYNRAQKVSSR
jgi:hypothetical protein